MTSPYCLEGFGETVKVAILDTVCVSVRRMLKDMKGLGAQGYLTLLKKSKKGERLLLRGFPAGMENEDGGQKPLWNCF